MALRQAAWSLLRAGVASDSTTAGSTLPTETPTYHTVVDCFSEDCDPLGLPRHTLFFLFPFSSSKHTQTFHCARHGKNTDCAAATLNAFAAFAILSLALAQVATMLRKRIWLTWKFFLTTFLFVQLALLLAQQLFFRSPVWTFVLFFLKMVVLLFILYFFAQYYFRVTCHSDELGPFAFFPFPILLFSPHTLQRDTHMW